MTKPGQDVNGIARTEADHHMKSSVKNPQALSRFTDWVKIVDAICKVLRQQSAVPCNLFDHENARPLLSMDSNANQIPFRSRFDSISFRKSGASRLDRCCLGILHG
jgi:hypothetical protein